MERSETPLSSGLSAHRACDSCRIRKVKCDRGSPCSPCKAANLPCRTETQGSKVQKHRVQVSKQYESKIDSIDHRLATIEQLLRRQAGSTPPSQTVSTPALSNGTSAYLDNDASVAPSTTLSISEDDASTHMQPAGYVGAQAESMAATSVLDQIIGRDPSVQHDAELTLALEQLRSIVHHNPSEASRSGPGLDPAPDVAEPGWEVVEALLRRAKKGTPVSFSLVPPTLFGDFCTKCRDMYEKQRVCSPTEKLLIYAGLCNTCSEFTGEGDEGSILYHHRLARVFLSLLMKTLATFPLLTPASIEALEALIVATLTLIGMCKPSAGWSLICKAAQMCQKLGYNRLSRSSPSMDPMYNRKTMLFWITYSLDRNIAFRLGHTPAIQDYDIDTPMVTVHPDLSAGVIDVFAFWVDCGRIQGKICTQLYGPGASSLTSEERIRIAESLAEEMEQTHERKNKATMAMVARAQLSQGQRFEGPWIHGDHIMHFSTISTALYAIPYPHPAHFRAIEAARECLRISRDLSNCYLHNIYNWTICCHWVLLHAPITTFTGVFYNVIANPSDSQDDIKLLEDFVTSLAPARKLSEPIEKFYQLASAFVKVAQAYIRAKTQQPSMSNGSGQIDPSAGMDLNGQYPAELGYKAAGQQQQIMDPFESLQEWYCGNASLYTLLEQDLGGSGFEFMDESAWPG